MTATTEVRKVFDTLLEPIGIKTRTFVVDYRDDRNKYYHREFSGVAIGNDSYTVNGLKEIVESDGYTVYGVYEVLNGYTNDEAEKMALHNPREAAKHVKLLYIDMSKERHRS